MLRSMMLLYTTSFLSVSTSEPPAISIGLEEPRTALFDCDPELHGLLCLSDLPAAEPPSPGVRPQPTGILAASLDAKPSYILVTTDSVDVVCAWSMALSCTGEIMARARSLSRVLLDRAPLPCKRHVKDHTSHSAGLKLQGKVSNLVSSSCGTARTVAILTCLGASCPSC